MRQTRGRADGGTIDRSSENIRRYERQLTCGVSEPDWDQADVLKKGFVTENSLAAAGRTSVHDHNTSAARPSLDGAGPFESPIGCSVIVNPCSITFARTSEQRSRYGSPN